MRQRRDGDIARCWKPGGFGFVVDALWMLAEHKTQVAKAYGGRDRAAARDEAFLLTL